MLKVLRVVDGGIGGDGNAQEEADLSQINEHVGKGFGATFRAVNMIRGVVDNRRHNQVNMQDAER